MDKYLLSMRNIHKRFPGVYALKGANLDVKAGEVHALVGENGSGKSTLVNCLGGIYEMDQGEVMIDGNPVDIKNVLTARDLGISVIHQELVLVPYLTVAENIFVNREPMKNGVVDFDKMVEDSKRFVDDLGLDLDVTRKVVTLSIAEQQMVEIVKAVSFDAKIVCMDEPTSSISDKEVDKLFENVKKLKERGLGIIYISHKMSELPIVADRVTVLRDGETIKTLNVADTNTDEIVRLMVGREMTNYYSRTYNEKGRVVLKAEGITSNKVNDVSFEVHAGEILGFAGLVGAGRTEVMKAIIGLDNRTGGKIYLDGKEVNIKRPSDAYANGIGYIPENRREEGIIPLNTVRFNISMKVLNKFVKHGRVDENKEQSIAQEYIDKLKIKTPNQKAKLQNLSGGNQQKVVVARWLATDPKVLIMDEPTRGIDVGAKAEIYALMNRLAEEGMAIIMISSELPEILNMSDRVVVMREGQITKVLDHSEATQENVMQNAVNI